MRNTDGSGNDACRTWFSSCADCEVATERLLDDDTRALVQPDTRQALHDVFEQRRRDRQVEQRMVAALQLQAEVVERGGVAVVAGDVRQPVDQPT